MKTALSVLELRHLHGTGIIETRVQHGKDKCAARLEKRLQCSHERLDLREVHQRHITKRGVEAGLAKTDHCSVVGGVDNTVVNVSAAFSRRGNHLLREIERHDLRTGARKPARAHAIAAGYVEKPIAGSQPQEAFNRGPNEHGKESLPSPIRSFQNSAFRFQASRAVALSRAVMRLPCQRIIQD